MTRNWCLNSTPLCSLPHIPGPQQMMHQKETPPTGWCMGGKAPQQAGRPWMTRVRAMHQYPHRDIHGCPLYICQPVSPVLLRSTSLLQPPPPAWTALLVALVRGVMGPQGALAVLLASMLLMGPAPPALPPSTSLLQPPHPAWSALLVSSQAALALPSWLTALL
jgi:hypothetical protein